MNQQQQAKLLVIFTEELKATFAVGFANACEHALLPALLELAQFKAQEESQEMSDRALLRWLIRTAATRLDKGQGLTPLLGLEDDEDPGLTRRREDAASDLGYKTGDSLRRSRPGDRPAVDLILSELAQRLADEAEELGFNYSRLRSHGKWFPDRQLYDYTVEADSYGARAQGPVFNSFVNTPSYGHEPSFLDGRRGDMSTMENADPVWDVADGDGTVVLRLYINNMAAFDQEEPDSSTARGAYVRVSLPEGMDTSLRVRGYIGAENADVVENTVDLIGNEPFRVEYIEGSAELLRNNASYELNDSIVEQGALVGGHRMDGVLDATDQFELTALVELRVQILT